MSVQFDQLTVNERRLLIVEDDQDLQRTLKRIFDRYAGSLLLTLATDAGQAREALADGEARNARFDAIILDLMLPYGSAVELDGDTDLDQLDTGIRLLQHLRDAQPDPASRTLVFVTTARANTAVLDQVRKLLAGAGALFTKPFDALEFEHTVVTALGLRSLVPAELLPSPSSDS